MNSFPNVWGEGNIFAFSGLDGKTDWNYPFIATLLKDRIGFVIRTEREKKFWIALRTENRIGEFINRKKNGFEQFSPDIVAGDIISLDFGIRIFKGQFLALPVSRNRFVISLSPGRLSRNTMLYLIFRIEACIKLFFDGDYFVMRTDKDTTFLSINKRVKDYYVVDSMEEVERIVNNRAEKRAKEWDGDKEVRYLVISLPLKKKKTVEISICAEKQGHKKVIDLKQAVKDRKDFYIKRMRGSEKSTLAKAFSVLKANVESPQRVFKQRWTTPDRWPHRHLWLWDSCFHSLGLVYIDKKLAEDSILSVLDIQQKNGFIPHIGRPNGNFSNITQPPLLSWAVWKVYQFTKNKVFLKRCYPKLEKYLKWCLRNRDRNRNRLLEWTRNDESGLDNSSRFNAGKRFDSIDYSCFIVNDLNSLYNIGREIGSENKWMKAKAKKIAKKIETYFWNKKEGFFFDRYFNGRFSSYKTVCGFLPLFAGVADNNQAEKLIQHLRNKNEFNTPFPVPSEPIDSPSFDNNMWRGPVWLNYNYFIIEGLMRYGFPDLGEMIKKKTLKEVEKWYKKEGTIFEFYDPFCKKSPKDIPRKDRYGAIKEFGWSAAIYIVLSMKADASL